MQAFVWAAEEPHAWGKVWEHVSGSSHHGLNGIAPTLHAWELGDEEQPAGKEVQYVALSPFPGGAPEQPLPMCHWPLLNILSATSLTDRRLVWSFHGVEPKGATQRNIEQIKLTGEVKTTCTSR